MRHEGNAAQSLAEHGSPDDRMVDEHCNHGDRAPTARNALRNLEAGDREEAEAKSACFYAQRESAACVFALSSGAEIQ
jgi:hypothetical protein